MEEAFYLSGATYDNYAEQTVYTELWYADASGTRYLESTEALDFSHGRVFDVGDCKLFCVEDNRTSTSETHVWTVRNGSPGRIQLAYGQQPGNVTQEDGRNFSFVFDAYDGASNGDGHTWKKYYMYWDGEGFTEYGGLRISEAQLRTVEGASQWLDEAIAIGGTIGDIFYRENGIVNVNYTTDGGWRDGTVDNNNLTLYVADGTAQLVYYDEATLQDSNQGGVYVANVLPKATFPDAFPFGGDSADVSGLLPAGYELLKQISTDLDGDGTEEQLAFSRVVGSEYGDAHIDMRVFSAAGEMIQALELQAYSPYGNCAVRAYLLPAEEGQRLFVESLGFSGDVHSKYYCLFGYSDGRLSEEVFVQDPGYSDGVGLYLGNSEHMGVLEPAEELFYTDDPGSDYEEEYLKALEGVLGGYGISFEFTEGYSFYAGESGGAIPYGPFRYAKAILPTECIWQWGHAPSGATAVEDEEGFVPVSADLVFAQYEEYGPLGGGVEGAPMVAVNAGRAALGGVCGRDGRACALGWVHRFCQLLPRFQPLSMRCCLRPLMAMPPLLGIPIVPAVASGCASNGRKRRGLPVLPSSTAMPRTQGRAEELPRAAGLALHKWDGLRPVLLAGRQRTDAVFSPLTVPSCAARCCSALMTPMLATNTTTSA